MRLDRKSMSGSNRSNIARSVLVVRRKALICCDLWKELMVIMPMMLMKPKYVNVMIDD